MDDFLKEFDLLLQKYPTVEGTFTVQPRIKIEKKPVPVQNPYINREAPLQQIPTVQQLPQDVNSKEGKEAFILGLEASAAAKLKSMPPLHTQ